jgi:hypothetical protein
MQLLRIVLVLAAAAAVTGQYLQERYRLAVLEKLPGRVARDRYEARRHRSERVMAVVTVVLGLLGLAALVDLILGGGRPR